MSPTKKPPPQWPLPLEPVPPLSAVELRRWRREELQQPQSIAAAALGVSVDTLRKWEQGANPVTETATRLIILWRCYAAAVEAAEEEA